MSDERPPGHLAIPPGPGPWPGVIVIHEAYGLNDDIRAHAERLARTGLLAFAPDLQTGSSRLRCVMRSFRELSARRGRSFAELETARSWLTGRPDCTGRIGVIGFCIGGGFALLAAAQSQYAAAAVNYGAVPKDAAEALRGVCPVVASYGGRDTSMRGAAARLQEALTGLGVPHDVREYPEAGHGFINRHQPLRIARIIAKAGFQQEAADDAWARIDAFFAEHLTTATDARR
ncbi:dienelactone hydrolase [Mycobacterium tuberculosis]|nr:dienelactone hydrolase [Mycobacterium tuberculosis]